MHCPGSPVRIGGIIRIVSGLYTDTLADVHGCDSLVIDTLRDYPLYRTSGNHFNICHGSGITIHGHYHTTAGVYIDTLLSSYRCDSLVFDTLSILPIPVVPGLGYISCPGQAIIMHGSLHGAIGIYQDTLSIAGTCDTIFVDTLHNYPTYIISGINYHICPGDSLNWNGQIYHSAQLLYDSLSSSFGCDSIVIDSLNINPIPTANAGADQQIIDGESASLHGTGGPPFMWSNGVNESTNVVSPRTDTFYILTVVNDSGCSATDTVFVHVLPKSGRIQVPDAFTPNGDGLNERFTVFGQGIKSYEISIFNRWGELIYYSKDLSELNNTNKGWDGTFMGAAQQSDTFIFMIKAMGEDSKLIIEQGSLTLIR
jgi:gliding motility-associated-like protein